MVRGAVADFRSELASGGGGGGGGGEQGGGAVADELSKHSLPGFSGSGVAEEVGVTSCTASQMPCCSEFFGAPLTDLRLWMARGSGPTQLTQCYLPEVLNEKVPLQESMQGYKAAHGNLESSME